MSTGVLRVILKRDELWRQMDQALHFYSMPFSFGQWLSCWFFQSSKKAKTLGREIPCPILVRFGNGRFKKYGENCKAHWLD